MSMKLIRITAVMERTGLAKSTIYKYMKKGIFPKTIKCGTRFAAWEESEIEAWIQNAIDRRDRELE